MQKWEEGGRKGRRGSGRVEMGVGGVGGGRRGQPEKGQEHSSKRRGQRGEGRKKGGWEPVASVDLRSALLWHAWWGFPSAGSDWMLSPKPSKSQTLFLRSSRPRWSGAGIAAARVPGVSVAVPFQGAA